MTTKIFRDFSQAELDVQYNARVAVPEFPQFAERWRHTSERVRRSCRCTLGVPYGAGPDEKLDVFHPDSARGPIQVFFHGGYWRSMNKEAFSFVAEPFVKNGAVVIVVDYSLCPAVTIGQIVIQCRSAVEWVYRNVHALAGAPGRIFLCGHSAGGHIAAKLLETDWSMVGGAGQDLAGVCAISGLYDLEPIRLSFLNADLRLDQEQARRNSPIYGAKKTGSPLILSVGGLESPEFHRQTQTYKEAWEAAGNDCEVIPAPGRHHYSVLDAFCDETHPLGNAVLTQMGLARGQPDAAF